MVKPHWGSARNTYLMSHNDFIIVFQIWEFGGYKYSMANIFSVWFPVGFGFLVSCKLYFISLFLLLPFDMNISFLTWWCSVNTILLSKNRWKQPKVINDWLLSSSDALLVSSANARLKVRSLLFSCKNLCSNLKGECKISVVYCLQP